MDQSIANTADQFGGGAAIPAGPAAGAPVADAPVGSADSRPSPSSGKDHQNAERHIYAGREWTTDHPLNVRVSIPIGIGRYYVTLIAGKERRDRARLARDRMQHPLDKSGNVTFLAFVSAIVTAGSITILYLLLAHIFGWSGRLML